MQRIFFTFHLIVFLVACAPAAVPPPTLTPQVISVYTSPATQPWLAEIYSCAKQASVLVRLSASATADLTLRLGEPESLTTPAFQIDSEEILIVTHRESPIQNLTADEARALFSLGQENVQIWVYASSADAQEIFEREIMRGSSIHSLARLAANSQQMSDILNAEQNAVGILPRHWKAGTVREVFTIPDVPVLAITPGEPQGAVKEIIACLQK